jgi:hypothetical protein
MEEDIEFEEYHKALKDRKTFDSSFKKKKNENNNEIQEENIDNETDIDVDTDIETELDTENETYIECKEGFEDNSQKPEKKRNKKEIMTKEERKERRDRKREKRLRKLRNDVVKKRHKDVMDIYDNEEKDKEQQENREDWFNKYNSLVNKTIRSKYEQENPDAVKSYKGYKHFTEHDLSEKDKIELQERKDQLEKHMSKSLVKQSENVPISRLSNLSSIQDKVKNRRKDKRDQNKRHYEYEPRDKKKENEPYNICNRNPFDVIYKKSRDVYNKRRNGLAYLQNERNEDELNNVCQRQTKYTNADDKMVLFPEYKWSVPQLRPPACVSDTKSEYKPMMAQTALIGTLLEDF